MGKLLERGCVYYANFIYNKSRLNNKRNEDPDWVLSLDVVKYVVELLASRGYDRTYYHDRDALPGGNIFKEFFLAEKKSMYTIVIITRGFLKDCWAQYKSQSAFVKRLESDKSRFIALCINLENDHAIPEELATTEVLSFGCKWKEDEDEWNKLKNVFPITDTGPDKYTVSAPYELLYSRQKDPVGQSMNKETKDGRSGHCSNDHSVQDTNPPDLTVLRMGQVGNDIGTDSPVSMDMEITLNGEISSRSQISQNTDPKQVVIPSNQRFDESLNQSDLEIDDGRSILDTAEILTLNGSQSDNQVKDLVLSRNRYQCAYNEHDKSIDSGLEISSDLGSNDDDIGPASIGSRRVNDTTSTSVGENENHKMPPQAMEASLNGENMSQGQRPQNTDPKRLPNAIEQNFDKSSLYQKDFKIGRTISGSNKLSVPMESKPSNQEKDPSQVQQCAQNEHDKSTEKQVNDTNPDPVGGGDDHKTLSIEETSLLKKKTDQVTIKDNKISLAGYCFKCICDISSYIFFKADQSFFLEWLVVFCHSSCYRQDKTRQDKTRQKFYLKSVH